MKDDELRELQNPENWDWENAWIIPGQQKLRQDWRKKGITWSDNMRMTDLKLNGGTQ